ncbi:hypothetical protein ABT369_43545 [Dactylosporangium sp. NPDC000244]|uniref:hypothetical protein n=1 Tax=Dactylosporangium sp. NPDC000244 TaxID=3154365 RepID=UPI00331A6E59
MTDIRRMRRWSAAAAAVAALGVGLIGAAATPAWAADQLEIKVDNSVQGKVGDKVQVRFVVKNNTKQPVTGVTVAMAAPGNAVLDAADNPGCTVGSGGRAATCRSNGTLAADKSASGQFTLTVKTAGQAAGRVQVEHGNADNFQLRATGGPTPSATGKSAKPTKTSSLSASETPGIDDDGSFGVPQAGNGVAIETTGPATNRTNGSGGGMSMGLWAGIIAIVGALGLIGSLFYFRRKDRNEPDTGMHPVVPAPQGFYGSQPQPTTYGTPPQPQTYGSPAAQTQMINPGLGGPPGPTQVIQPGNGPVPGAGPGGGPVPGNDQTVIFRRPEDL